MTYKQLGWELSFVQQQLVSADPYMVGVRRSFDQIQRASSDLAAIMTHIRELEVEHENLLEELGTNDLA